MRDDFIDEIRRFYVENRQQLYVYALSLTRNCEAAEDVIHWAFCRVLKRGRVPRELRPYVFRCVRNAAVDEARAVERRANGALILAAPAEADDPELQASLERVLQSLNDDERESIVLKIYSGMTFREIAALRGVSISTAASWYRRGLEKMRVALQGGDVGGLR